MSDIVVERVPNRLSLWQRWYRLRTSPRFPYLLLLTLLVLGGLAQVYSYCWGLRIAWMVKRNQGAVHSNRRLPRWLHTKVGSQWLDPLEPVVHVTLAPKSEIRSADLALLRGTSSLWWLGLAGPVAQDGWKQIGQLSNLQSLTLDGPGQVIRKEDFQHLAGLSKLRSLNLFDVTFDVDGLAHFADHPSLHELSINSISSLDGVLTKFAEGSKADHSTGAWPSSPASMRILARQRTLSKLMVANYPDFRDEHLLALTAPLDDGMPPLPSLKSLSLIGTGVTRDGVLRIDNLPRLEGLDLTGISLGNDGLRGLKHHTTLKRLGLSLTRIGDRDVETLLTMPNLTNVDVSGTGISNEGLLKLSTHPQLRRMVVGAFVPEATVIAIRSRVPCYVAPP